jgi:Lon protease-like protein
VKSLRIHKKRCPTCRIICVISPENAAENIIIKSLAISLNPALYAQRQEEVRIEKNDWATIYPVFYYNQSLFPGSRLSLHLFEERYKVMMQRVVDTTRSFAYVPNFTNYSAKVDDIALIAELKEVEFMVDGRCILEAILSKRKRITYHFIEDGTHGLHFCKLENFDDLPIEEAYKQHAAALHERTTLLANFFLETHSRNSLEYHYGTMPTELEAFSLWLCAISPLSEIEKYHFLTTRNTLERIDKCKQKLEAFLERFNRSIFNANVGATITSTGMHIFEQLTSLVTRSIANNNNDNTNINSSNNINNGNDDNNNNNVPSNVFQEIQQNIQETENNNNDHNTESP